MTGRIEFISQHDMFHLIGISDGNGDEPMPRHVRRGPTKHFVELLRHSFQFRTPRGPDSLFQSRNFTLTRPYRIQLIQHHNDRKD